MAHAPSGPAASRLERAAAASFLLYAAALPWSVAPMSIAVLLCAALTVACWWRPGGVRWVRTPIDLPALGWIAALVLASLFALDPADSWPNVKKGLLLAVVPLAAYHARDERAGRRAIAALLLSAAAATIYALVRFAHDGGAFPARVRGLVGHPLTYGGQAMFLISLCLSVALRVRDRRWRGGAVALGLLVTPALLGSFTRSAWIGTLVSFAVIVGRTRARWLPLLVAAPIAALFVLPAGYRVRAMSAIDLRNSWNVERLLLWDAGLRMFRDHPITGVGIQDLHPLIERYRKPGAHEHHGHLHNVVLQVAATMGVVGLVALVGLWVGFARTALAPPSFRPPVRAGPRPLAEPLDGMAPEAPPPISDMGAAARNAAIGILAGFIVAGLFEWNLGDEELLEFFAALIGIAFAARDWRPGNGRRDR